MLFVDCGEDLDFVWFDYFDVITVGFFANRL